MYGRTSGSTNQLLEDDKSVLHRQRRGRHVRHTGERIEMDGQEPLRVEECAGRARRGQRLREQLGRRSAGLPDRVYASQPERHRAVGRCAARNLPVEPDSSHCRRHQHPRYGQHQPKPAHEQPDHPRQHLGRPWHGMGKRCQDVSNWRWRQWVRLRSQHGGLERFVAGGAVRRFRDVADADHQLRLHKQHGGAPDIWIHGCQHVAGTLDHQRVTFRAA